MKKNESAIWKNKGNILCPTYIDYYPLDVRLLSGCCPVKKRTTTGQQADNKRTTSGQQEAHFTFIYFFSPFQYHCKTSHRTTDYQIKNVELMTKIRI